MKKNNKKGFTLVELVIVVAVMAVLVAVAIPTVGSIVGTAEEATAESNARTIESIIKLAEANDKDGDTDLSESEVAQALYDAKLGISAESNTDTKATFYYTPATGAVVPAKSTGNVGWKIEFSVPDATTGNITVTVTNATTVGTANSAST